MNYSSIIFFVFFIIVLTDIVFSYYTIKFHSKVRDGKAYLYGSVGFLIISSIPLLMSLGYFKDNYLVIIPVLIFLHYINQIYIFNQNVKFIGKSKYYFYNSALVIISNIIPVTIVSIVLSIFIGVLTFVIVDRQFHINRYIKMMLVVLHFLLSLNSVVYYYDYNLYIALWMILLAMVFYIRKAELIILENQNAQDLNRFNKELLDGELTFKESVLEALPAAVLVTDYSSNILYANRAVETVTGYSRQELLGKKPSIFKSGNTPFEVYGDMRSSIENGRKWEGTIQNKRKDGTLYWESLRIIPVRNRKNLISHYIGLKLDSSKEKVESEILERKANYDDLTGLLRRAKFEEIAKEELSNFFNRRTYVVNVDVDNFKSINDVYGHMVGDKILKEISEVLKNRFKEIRSFISRQGGDEFSILAVKTSKKELMIIMEKVKEDLSKLSLDSGDIIDVDLSFGIAKVGDNLLSSLALADKTMYLNKKTKIK